MKGLTIRASAYNVDVLKVRVTDNDTKTKNQKIERNQTYV